MNMIRIILAEDHHIVRDGLRSLLEAEADLQIIAQATDGSEVIRLLENGLEADILLTDVNMPVIGGPELTVVVTERYPQIRTIALSALDHETYVIQMLKAGACGYLLKNVAAPELIFAIRQVAAGQQYVCSELAAKFFKRLLNAPKPMRAETDHEVSFSDRELEVLVLLAEGMTNQEIADQVCSSKRTIEGYRESMITKSGVRNTAALIRFAVANGFIN